MGSHHQDAEHVFCTVWNTKLYLRWIETGYLRTILIRIQPLYCEGPVQHDSCQLGSCYSIVSDVLKISWPLIIKLIHDLINKNFTRPLTKHGNNSMDSYINIL